MEYYDYLILGGGPAGLTIANRLKEKGKDSFLVLEKEADAGGLCRSREVDGSPLDIGGGHILDVRRPEVVRYLFRFMPENEWNEFGRVSTIRLKDGLEIDYPFEANIWQLPEEEQEEHLKSIAAAGCNQGKERPDKFPDWVYWKLGKKIADDYMIPYNSKMWSIDLDRLGTYWLEKLPDVSYEDTKRSCQEKKMFGTLPGHSRFYYPKKYGYGELWLRMADAVREHIAYREKAVTIDLEKRVVNGTYCGRKIINTIPWVDFKSIEGADSEFFHSLKRLVHTSVVIQYSDRSRNTDAHWTYIPDPELEQHRELYRGNFCPGAKGYWTESNRNRTSLDTDCWRYVNEYGYPVNTIDKPAAIRYILEYAGKRGVIGLGRWGEWEHYNSDVTVKLAMELAERI